MYCAKWCSWTFGVAQLHLVAKQNWSVSGRPLLSFILAFLLPGNALLGYRRCVTQEYQYRESGALEEGQILRGLGYPVSSHYGPSLALQPAANRWTLSIASSLIKETLHRTVGRLQRAMGCQVHSLARKPGHSVTTPLTASPICRTDWTIPGSNSVTTRVVTLSVQLRRTAENHK